jgi:amino acid permease
LEEPESRIELQKKLIDVQLKQEKETTYMRILMSFGVIAIVIGTIVIISQDLTLSAQSITMYGMGIFLLLAGLFWQEKNKSEISSLEKKIEEFEDDDMESERVSTEY